MPLPRRPLIAANWKMHKTAEEAVRFAVELKPLLADACAACEVVICPPYTNIVPLCAALKGSAVQLGAQNTHWEDSGAFTGEVSPLMILTSGCSWVILGHSERRQLFGETNESVNRKLAASLQAGLRAIVCVGETLEEREAGQIERVVLGQVEAALNGISTDAALRIAFAYEPIWAIGTGRTASPAQAEEVHLLIRNLLRSTHGDAVADAIRIQYGGSVKPENAAELFGQENIDGGLIGGASLEAESFAAIIEAAARRS